MPKPVARTQKCRGPSAQATVSVTRATVETEFVQTPGTLRRSRNARREETGEAARSSQKKRSRIGGEGRAGDVERQSALARRVARVMLREIGHERLVRRLVSGPCFGLCFGFPVGFAVSFFFGFSVGFDLGLGGGLGVQRGGGLGRAATGSSIECVGGGIGATGSRISLMFVPADSTLRTREVRSETMSGGSRAICRFFLMQSPGLPPTSSIQTDSCSAQIELDRFRDGQESRSIAGCAGRRAENRFSRSKRSNRRHAP
jgi:hypothetical protein